MDVLGDCPLPVASILWQTTSRAITLAVGGKATYTLKPAESPLAQAQDEPSSPSPACLDASRSSASAPFVFPLLDAYERGGAP